MLNTKNIIILAIIIFFLVVIIVITSINRNHGKKASAEVKTDILEINIILKDHKFIPDIIEIPKATKVKLVIHNQDDTAEEFESHDLHREKIIMPHGFINVILAPLAPGKYDFFGDFNQETAQGSIIVNH